VPAVAERGDPLERAGRVAADPDGDGAAGGARAAAELVEAEELALERHAVVAPAGAHDPDGLVGPGAATGVGNAQQLDLLAHPAHAGAQDDPTWRQVVERGQHLGGQHGMAVR
jgi:hypothetical protein